MVRHTERRRCQTPAECRFHRRTVRHRCGALQLGTKRLCHSYRTHTGGESTPSSQAAPVPPTASSGVDMTAAMGRTSSRRRTVSVTETAIKSSTVFPMSCAACFRFSAPTACALCESAGTARGCPAREARLDERGAGSQAGLGDDAHHASLLGRHSCHRRRSTRASWTARTSSAA